MGFSCHAQSERSGWKGLVGAGGKTDPVDPPGGLVGAGDGKVLCLHFRGGPVKLPPEKAISTVSTLASVLSHASMVVRTSVSSGAALCVVIRR